MNKIFFLSLIVLLVAMAAHGQSDWHTYPLRTISDLVRQERQMADNTPKADMIISAKPFPAKTILTYTGKKRPCDSLTRSFVRLWAESKNLPPSNAGQLIEEFLFIESGNEYWLPVLKATVPKLEKEVKEGDEIMAYYFYLGGFNSKTLNDKAIEKDKSIVAPVDSIRWILAVETYEKFVSSFTAQPLEKAIDRSIEAKQISEVWFDPRQIRSRTRVNFTGDIRRVTGKRQQLLELWFDKNGFPATSSSLMQKEARFIDGNTEYWIVLRNKSLEEITKNIKKGDSVVLNSILAGATKDSDKVDWVFLSGEYKP